MVRTEEFHRIGDALYLDHAGATLHSEAQLAEVLAHLNGALMGNPHSLNDSSIKSSNDVERARDLVLRHFNTTAQEHELVFTANATAALKLVGECFPWGKGSQFAYTVQNHNSVLGIREYAAQHGAGFVALGYDRLRTELQQTPASGGGEQQGRPPKHSLFAFPGECNFSGQKLDLRLVDHFRMGRSQC